MAGSPSIAQPDARVHWLTVSGNALIAPSQVSIKLLPLSLHTLQGQVRQATEFVAGIFLYFVSAAFSTEVFWTNTMPNLAGKPRMRFIKTVRSSLKTSRK